MSVRRIALVWLLTSVTTVLAFGLVIFGGLAAGVPGATAAAIVGGLLVTLARRRLADGPGLLAASFGWGAWILVAGLVGQGVYHLLPSPDPLWSVLAMVTPGALLGGLWAGAIEARSAFPPRKNRLLWTLWIGAAFGLGSTVAAAGFRLGNVGLGIAFGAMLYAAVVLRAQLTARL